MQQAFSLFGYDADADNGLTSDTRECRIDVQPASITIDLPTPNGDDRAVMIEWQPGKGWFVRSYQPDLTDAPCNVAVLGDDGTFRLGDE